MDSGPRFIVPNVPGSGGPFPKANVTISESDTKPVVDSTASSWKQGLVGAAVLFVV